MAVNGDMGHEGGVVTRKFGPDGIEVEVRERDFLGVRFIGVDHKAVTTILESLAHEL